MNLDYVKYEASREKHSTHEFFAGNIETSNFFRNVKEIRHKTLSNISNPHLLSALQNSQILFSSMNYDVFFSTATQIFMRITNDITATYGCEYKFFSGAC